MLGLTVEMEEDVRKHDNFRARGFRKIVKGALKSTALFWHRRYAPQHFTRAAYTRYGGLGAYRKQKKAGDPMVETGTFRDRLLAPRSKSDVKGTSRGVRLHFKFGRPPQYTEKMLRRRAWILVVTKRISLKAALRRVYRGAGYSKAAKMMFKSHVPAVSGPEVRSLRVHTRDHIVAALNKAGPRRKRKLR